uniref:Cytochrome b561 domain-containing protein n=1 Tax=Chrysotila carterae TaxID=13221 RepID=A0A7S4F6H0_CHRCT
MSAVGDYYRIIDAYTPSRSTPQADYLWPNASDAQGQDVLDAIGWETPTFSLFKFRRSITVDCACETAQAEAQAEAEAEAEAEADSEAEAEAGGEADSEPDSAADAEAEDESRRLSEPTTEPTAEAEAETTAEAEAEAEAEGSNGGEKAAPACFCTDHAIVDDFMDIIYAHGQVPGTVADTTQGLPAFGVIPGSTTDIDFYHDDEIKYHSRLHRSARILNMHTGEVFVSASPAGDACTPSNLGFDCMLTPAGAPNAWTLHWTLSADETSAAMAVTATVTSGWIGVGFSSDGSMIGSDAVIGTVGGAASGYLLNAKSTAGVVATTDETVGLTSPAAMSVTNGVARLDFEKTLQAGNVPVSADSATMLWALGPVAGGNIAQHSARAPFGVSLSGGADVAGPDVEDLSDEYLAHGVLMMISWGFLLPSGILIAIYGKKFAPFWFYLHIVFQVIGLILSIAGLSLAINKFGGFSDEEYIKSVHGKTGIFLMCLAMFQPLNGLVRPHHGRPLRPLWEVLHKSCGRIALALSVPVIVLGIYLLDTIQGADYTDFFIKAMGSYMGMIATLALLAGIAEQTVSKKEELDSSGTSGSSSTDGVEKRTAKNDFPKENV